MSRNERDWNRRIPERQAPRAEASRLLRSVASEHIPEPDPAPVLTGSWSLPSTMTSGISDSALNTGFSLGSLMRQSTTTRRSTFDDYLFRDTITQLGRSPGRSHYVGDFGSFIDDNARNEILDSIRTQSSNTITSNRINWGNAQGGGGGGNLGGGGSGVTPPLQEISRNPRNEAYPIPYRLEVRVDGQSAVNTHIAINSQEFDPVRANRLTENLRRHVQEETQRVLREGLSNISRELDRTNGMSRVTHQTNTNDILQMQGYSTITGPNLSATLVNSVSPNQSNMLEDIKAWLKGALEIRTEVSEEEGSLSVKTTILLDGEEISSDDDFTQINTTG